MDDDQQFCLRWNNHQSTLVAVFDTLLENGTLVDCTLAAEGKFLNAHKVVLSACSPYFEALLSRHYDKHPILILKDVKFQELKAMMDYMYRGEVNISQDQLGALLKAAESLQIKGLSDNKKDEAAPKKSAPSAASAPKSPPPQPVPKVQGLTIEQRSRDDSREGSVSPGPRKKKRMRRKSEDDVHDASNSSESHSLPSSNIPASAAQKMLSQDAMDQVETKQEILTRHKEEVAQGGGGLPQQQQHANQAPPPSHQVPMIKEKLETHSELMLEPKSEYVEEMNEDSIEDLTLDDDDLSNMDQMDDGSTAGPSHAGEGSSQQQEAGASTSGLPEKSKVQYENTYLQFKEWCRKKGETGAPSEALLLAYLKDKSERVKASTLWSTYSMLKSTLSANEGIDIGRFKKLVQFLKAKSVGYRNTPSRVFTWEQLTRFLTEAEDDRFLMMKIVLIVGVSGACRRDELARMTLDDVEDAGSVLIMKIAGEGAEIGRTFVVTDSLHVELCKRYIERRPCRPTTRRLFLKYQNGGCINQVVGVNKIGEIPSLVAKFLGLPHPEAYTARCFRRMSAEMHGGEFFGRRRRSRWPFTCSRDVPVETETVPEEISEDLCSVKSEHLEYDEGET